MGTHHFLERFMAVLLVTWTGDKEPKKPWLLIEFGISS